MKNKFKLLIIGRKSFIAESLFKFLKNKINVKLISFEKFKLCQVEYLKKFEYICNSSITKKYSTRKYNIKNDLDLIIVNKIKNIDIKYIFLSSRKIYKPGPNLFENSEIEPVDEYGKNKFITETKIKKIISNRLLILRISNLIGKKIKHKNQRKISKTFIDNYYKNIKKNKIIYYFDEYKDFLSIDQFNKIFLEILKKKLTGIYNLSLGKKVFISEIINSLNKFKKKNIFKKIDSKKNKGFYLNNNKLLKKINLNLRKKDVLFYCYKI